MFLSAINNQQDLSNNINKLNHMVQWNGWDCQLVKLDSVEKLIYDNENLIKTTQDWHLCQSLTKLGERITEEPFFNSEAKILAQFINDLIPKHLLCDPDMPPFISTVPEDIRDNVMHLLEKRELISFSQTSKQMHNLAEKWMPIKTEELLLFLFNSCILNKHNYNLNVNAEQVQSAQFQITFCSKLSSGTQMKIENIRSAFLPLFENVDLSVIKFLPLIFYDDKPLILNLIKVCKPREYFHYDIFNSSDKFEVAYLELLKANKVQTSNLCLDMNSINIKMAHTFADLIRINGKSWQITLLNVPVKYNFWGTKVIDNSPENYQIISTAINEKKFRQLTQNMSYGDDSCNYEIYGSGLKNTWLPR